MSMRLASCALLAAIALAACQVTLPPGPGAGGLMTNKGNPAADKGGPASKPSASPLVAAGGPSALPKPTPGGPASATPAPAGSPAKLEAAPETALLTGTVKLDAAYAVSSGLGHVVANHGAEAVQFAESSLIANNAGNLIANNGGGVLAAWGAGLIANNGGGLISDKGSGLISDKGSGLISDKGSGLISDKGSGLIANNAGGLTASQGSGYRLGAFGLLQAAASPAAGPATGTILPAAGMLVGVVDLTTGIQRPIGQDDKGQAAYAVYSDSEGRYALHLPAALAANVAVVAVPPTTERIDRRLRLDLVSPPHGDAAALDEDTALASRFMRAFLVGQLVDYMIKDPEQVVIRTGAVGGGLKDVLLAFFKELNAASQASGLAKADPAEVTRVAQRVSDILLAHVTLADVTITKELAPLWPGEPTPALPTIIGVLKEAREKATDALRQDPRFFEGQAYMVTANTGRAAADRYEVLKPSDLGDFVVRAFLLQGHGATEGVDAIFASIGVGTTSPKGVNSGRVAIEAGALAFGAGIVTVALANTDGAHDQGIAAVRDWKPSP